MTRVTAMCAVHVHFLQKIPKENKKSKFLKVFVPFVETMGWGCNEPNRVNDNAALGSSAVSCSNNKLARTDNVLAADGDNPLSCCCSSCCVCELWRIIILSLVSLVVATLSLRMDFISLKSLMLNCNFNA